MDQQLLKWFPILKWVLVGWFTLMSAGVGLAWRISSQVTEMNDRQKSNEEKIDYILRYLEQNGAKNFGVPFIPGVSFNQAPGDQQDAVDQSIER